MSGTNEATDQIMDLINKLAIYIRDDAPDIFQIGERTVEIAHAIDAALTSERSKTREEAATLAADFHWTLPMWEADYSPNLASDDAAEMVKDQIATAIRALA